MMLESPPNTYASIARRITMCGLNRQRNVVLPRQFEEIAKEMFAVPEKPLLYKPKFRQDKPLNIVLVTGGLDSTVLYRKMEKDLGAGTVLGATYVSMGQPYTVKEKDALDKLRIKYGTVVCQEFFGTDKKYWKHILPARNFFIFCKVAELFHASGTIYFGSTEGEMPDFGGDKSKRFLNLANFLLGTLPFPVQVETPLETYTKTDLVKWWIEQNLPEQDLENTISCFSEDQGHCGCCQACLRKAIAFINNNLRLKTIVQVTSGSREYINKYKKLMNKALLELDFSKYSERRCLQDLAGISLLEKYGI